MQTIAVNLSHASYEIRVGSGLFRTLRDQLASVHLKEPYLVVSQPRILKRLGRSLKKEDFTVVEIPDGEKAKTLTSISRLIDVMVKKNMTRQSTVVALGGGVVGDVAGFAASIYMRGIAVVQVPTTLLAQVDSSIGGKTGVNHNVAKNLIGTFYQPRLVLSDPELLQSLPQREYLSGLYEALKYGIILDPSLFDEFEVGITSLLSRDLDAVERLVGACAAIKAMVVVKDEKESGLRRVLNFGHTVGHGLEAAGKFKKIKHGEAVGYGMIAATRISSAMGRLPESDRIRIESAIRSVSRLPYLDGVRIQDVFNALQHDKKVRDGVVHFVLPRKIGSVEITQDVPLKLVRDVVKGLLDESQRISRS